MNGLLRPTSGHVFIDGTDIWAKPKKISAYRFIVGLVFQYPEYQLFEETVYKDIAFGPVNMKLDKSEIDRRVLQAADFVGLDQSLLTNSPFELSGGQKRRAAIASIMSMQPEVLVLDEPTAGLDPKGRTSILKSIKEYHAASGKTVVLISHSMEDIASLCERIIVLNKGTVELSGAPSDIFKNAFDLTSIGLAIPHITRVMLELSNRGLPVETNIFTIEAARDEILRALSAVGKEIGRD